MKRGRKPNSTTTKEIYNYILSYKAKNDGNSPSIREIMSQTSVNSTSVVQHHLLKLVDMGLIEKVDKKFRSILIVGGYEGAEWPEGK
jgi:SOS-response transcriptional repressor LexA